MHAGSMSVSSLFIFLTLPLLLLNFTFTTVDNIYHSQNVSSNRNETLTFTRSYSAETVQFRHGFKLLRLAFRFRVKHGYGRTDDNSDLKQAERQRDDDGY